MWVPLRFTIESDFDIQVVNSKTNAKVTKHADIEVMTFVSFSNKWKGTRGIIGFSPGSQNMVGYNFGDQFMKNNDY
jgi:hypothetical protein